LEAKITVLSEDNDTLRSQHDELARTNKVNKDQITKLKREKATWQDKCMQLMAKRHRDGDSEPGSSKRVVEERSNSAPGTPTDIEKTTVDEVPDTLSTSNTSNTFITDNTSSTLHTSSAREDRQPTSEVLNARRQSSGVDELSDCKKEEIR
jgi:hypothetical protein